MLAITSSPNILAGGVCCRCCARKKLADELVHTALYPIVGEKTLRELVAASIPDRRTPRGAGHGPCGR